MKKRTLSFFLCLAMVTSLFVQAFPAAVAAEADGSVAVLRAGEPVSEISIAREEKTTLTASFVGAEDCQWQILLSPESDQWVDIYDKTAPDCEVSYALVKNLLDDSGSAYLRCAVTGETTVYSDPVCVTVMPGEQSGEESAGEPSAPLAPAPLPAPVAEANEPGEEVEEFLAMAEMTAFTLLADEDSGSTVTDEDKTIYTVTIEYVYGDSSKFVGQRVALPYIAEVAAGDTLDKVVDSPECVGYLPDYSSINLADLGVIEGNISLKVEYSPAEVSYTVRHYQQNVDDDEYTHVDTTLATGKTESLTSDAAAKDYTGFTALTHFHEEIAADGSTMIDIYYDRDYYLMSFGLDGGYGVDPIYARYGTPISVGTPYKAGWTFAGWDATIPSTMPAENTTYTASWTANTGIPFTVAYWLEDANVEGKYNFWGSTTQTAEAGATVQGENYKDYSAIADGLDTYEKRYSYYHHADTDVVIKGDGSTVVNVYYNRNEYTLKFYYAARTETDGAYTYKIFGGSTYDFGQDNSNSYNGDELQLLNNMYTNKSNQWGAVTSEPTLNSTGVARVTGGIYTKGVDTYYNVSYLYISFTAKYGEDISGAWPCNVFDAATRTSVDNNANGWTGTAAYVSAWNGEHHVYYSQHNTNETIKGNYNELDYQLLFDNCGTHNFTDSSTVAYLCFWENGSGTVNWNVPELYRYNIWVPVLEGQDTTGLTTKEYNGVTYYLRNVYDTCDNSTVGEQTAPAINGYELVAGPVEGDTLINPDATKYQSAFNVDFFYSRETNDLIFVNGDATAKSDSVPFGADISGMAPQDLEYYDEDLKDLYTFDGWYTSPDTLDGSEYTLTGATMPANPLTLYAKWNLITHDVKIYPTEEDAKNGTNQIGATVAITHDEPVPEDSRPATPASTEENTFIGWFYKDENGDEQAFDFATMTITQDMTVYAKWRSNASKDVTIHYVVEDENGNQTTIADSETIKLRLGQTRTFEAKTGNSLYTEYRAGCFPTTASHSIEIDQEDIDSENPVTYTFVYKQYGKVPYQVEFYVQELDGTKRPAFKKNTDGKAVFMETYEATADVYTEQHWDNDKAVVVELYVPDDLSDPTWELPEAYIPNALKLQKVIVPSETDPETNIAANTIEFIYTYTEKVPDPENPGQKLYPAKYLVQHFIQNVPNTTVYDLYSWSTHEGLETKIATANPISIPGYTYSFDVTNANKQSGTTVTQNPDSMSGTITADDSLELNFYYNANPYPYRVLYLEEGTNQQVADPKTGMTALFGATVTENAPEIEGYDIVGDSTKSIQIKMEAGTTAQVNTITFYYERKNADLIISKTVKLDEEQAKEVGIDTLPESATTQEFTFNIYCPTGYNKAIYDCTITADGEEDVKGKIQITDGFNMTVRLKHGQTIQIHELIMGTYTITETYVPGFRITVNGGSDAQQKENVSITAKLVEADQDVQVDFVNSYPFFTGDLVLGKTVTKADVSDPKATKPYKVTVTLTPAPETREVDRVITWTNAGASEASSFTVPMLTGANDETVFTFDVLVPVDGTVTLRGVPAGDFTAEETIQGTVGYISDYYSVRTYSKLHNNEQTEVATGAAVSSMIHGGHATTVNFTNTYKKGDLTVSKTVDQEYVNDNWTEDTFTFAITGTTELPDGVYTVDGAIVTVADGKVTVKDENGNDPVISVARTEGEDSWTESLAIENLPAGYYTVTEKSSTNGLDKYTSVGPEGSLLVNNTATPTEANFTNTYKRTTGNLQISKTIKIVGDENIYQIDKDQEFTFTVSLTDGVLTGEYTCSDGTKLKADKDGKLTFNLKHDQYILIKGLPVGVYKVEETRVDGYASYFNSNSSASESTSVTVTTDATTELACRNEYPVNFGTLKVSKTVVTPEGYTEINTAPEDDEFTFTVKISDYSSQVNLDNGVKATFHRNENTSATVETLNVENNTLAFTLKAGQSVELELPACNYIVAETGLRSSVNTTGTLADHYTTSYTVKNVDGTENASYTLSSAEKEEVVFINTYKLHYANLTIDNTNSPDEADQVYVYEVKSKTTDLAITVTVVGAGATTIHNLPVGKYTVTQQDDWSWRYNGYVETVTLDNPKGETLEVSQTVKNGSWLDGVSELIKNVKGG